MQKLIPALICILCLATPPSSSAAEKKPAKVLVVTVTFGFRHDSISTAEKILAQIGEKSGAFTVDYIHQGATPEESRKNLEGMSADALKGYQAVIFVNTTGDLPLPDNKAFIDWVKEGGAFIGMHSATDTFHGFRPYIEMIGGEFETHGAQATVECLNQAPDLPACKHLDKTWTVHDEIYILKNFHRDQVHSLLSLDKHPNSKEPGDYPIAWSKNVGKGRVFYTSLGHRKDVWESDVYQKHILGGIQWALEPTKD